MAVGGVDPDRLYVDKGCRGHNYAGAGKVMIAGQRRGLTHTIRRELKRRSAVEATIGHMKTDGRLDRNCLFGRDGDAANALLVPLVTICASLSRFWRFGVPLSSPRSPAPSQKLILLPVF